MNPMPRRTDRLHLMPYWYGDSPAAFKVAAKKKVGSDGGKYTDTNVQATKDGAVCMHWGTPAKNGYFFIVKENGRRRRRLTAQEAHRPLLQWATKDVLRLRRTLRTGRRYEARVRPITAQEAVTIAHRLGVIPCFELKSSHFKNPERIKPIIAHANKIGATCYFMALVNMVEWGGKAKAVKAAGGQFALLAHNQPKPSNFNFYKPYITRVWGQWAA
jgi:hypothetical protein